MPREHEVVNVKECKRAKIILNKQSKLSASFTDGLLLLILM